MAKRRVRFRAVGDIAVPESNRFPAILAISPQVPGTAPLTKRTESSSQVHLAPQTGLERRTFWLTAERQRRSHRCKPTSKKARRGRSRAGEWGLPTLLVDPVGALPAFRLEGLDGVTGFLHGAGP